MRNVLRSGISYKAGLKNLGFEIEEEFKLIDYVTRDDAQEAIKNFVGNERLRDHDMVAVVIMTHGSIAAQMDEHRNVVGQDQEFLFSGE